MKTVFVGLSGGVDSAVSAYLLKKQGYKAVGVFLKVWEPDFLPCTSGQDRLDAMRVAAHLEIPFLSYDLEEEYKKGVVDYFIGEYRAGRTPNPDVMCNREIKFGAFWERAKADGADCIATGHYAKKEKIKNQKSKIEYKLLRGVDEGKDQSYFLWTLTQEDLAHSLFPVGGLHKEETRRLAAEAGLPNATKRDSQGLCFLGHVDMKEFLQHYIPVERGVIRDIEGAVVGEHDGVAFYTIEQRFPIHTNKKMYVIEKNIEKNELIVAPSVHVESAKNVYELSSVNWIHEVPHAGTVYHAQVRYHGESHEVVVRDGALLEFLKPVRVASGQSIVLYDTDNLECLGGGVVR